MSSVREIDHGWRRIRRELERIQRLEVAVGILEGSNNEGVSIAEYAAFNEFGTHDIPSRPFMAPAFDENVAKIEDDFKKQYRQITSGARDSNGALTVVGQKHASRIQNVITGRNILPRLAPATVQAKRGSTKTLVDTGAMVNAVHIEIRGRS